MKSPDSHRALLAAFLAVLLFAGTQAHAESDDDHGSSGSSNSSGSTSQTKSGGGDKNWSGGGEHHHNYFENGNNDDGFFPGTVAGTPSNLSNTIAGTNAATAPGLPGAPVQGGSEGVGGNTDSQHRRFGEIVSSPILDPQQIKTVIDSGKAASMPLLLTYLNQNYPGEVLDIKLHYANEGYVYEVRYLSNVIVLRTVFLDAATLKAK